MPFKILAPVDLTFSPEGEVGAWYESRVRVQRNGVGCVGGDPESPRIDKASRVQYS